MPNSFSTDSWGPLQTVLIVCLTVREPLPQSSGGTGCDQHESWAWLRSPPPVSLLCYGVAIVCLGMVTYRLYLNLCLLYTPGEADRWSLRIRMSEAGFLGAASMNVDLSGEFLTDMFINSGCWTVMESQCTTSVLRTEVRGLAWWRLPTRAHTWSTQISGSRGKQFFLKNEKYPCTYSI